MVTYIVADKGLKNERAAFAGVIWCGGAQRRWSGRLRSESVQPVRAARPMVRRQGRLRSYQILRGCDPRKTLIDQCR